MRTAKSKDISTSNPPNSQQRERCVDQAKSGRYQNDPVRRQQRLDALKEGHLRRKIALQKRVASMTARERRLYDREVRAKKLEKNKYNQEYYRKKILIYLQRTPF